MMQVIEQVGKTIQSRVLTDAEVRAIATIDREAMKEALRLDWPTLTAAQKIERIKELLTA